MVALLAFAFVTAWYAVRSSENSAPARSYAIGEPAVEEVIAPRNISWVDSLETEVRRERELAKGPVLFRVDPAVSTRVVERFNLAVASTRASFLDSMEKLFGTRRLNSGQVEGQLFRQLVIDYRREHPGFPITVLKAGRWAQGDEEETIQQALSDKLAAASKKLVHPDGWPSAAHGDHLRLISSDALSESNVDLLKQSKLVRRTNIVAISKVREMLQAQLPREQQATAKYLAGFIEVNCRFDADLTRQLREQRARAIKVVQSFDKGSLIAGQGQIVDAKIKTALDALNIQYRPVALKKNGTRQVWLWSASAFCFAVAMVLLLRWILRPGLHQTSAQNVVVLPRVELDGQALESGLMPHLARALMNKLVRGLISQRTKLLTAQVEGTDQLNDLEQKLEKISSRLQSRQAAYEKRIAELETELAVAEEENRELIRAKIRDARENLERARSQVGKQ